LSAYCGYQFLEPLLPAEPSPLLLVKLFEDGIQDLDKYVGE
jgi:hypothetical protein